MRKVLSFVALFLIFAASSCSSPDDVSGYICGAWQSEWKDNIGEDDVEDIRVKEKIGFIPSNETGTAGNFMQVFEGEVDFDDWDYEQTLNFTLYVEGLWNVEDKDNVVLRYNLDSIELACGKSKVGTDYTSAAVDLLTGNWASAIVGGLMQESIVDEANKKIDKSVEKQLLRYFKDMFRQMNIDREALTDVVITDDVMKCEVNHGGFFGRDAVYDRLNIESADDESSAEASSPNSTSSKTDMASNVSSRGLLRSGSLWYFEGEIDNKYPIVMVLDIDEKSGSYRYTKTGNGESIDIVIHESDPSTGFLHLKEYYKGNCSGEFNGYVTEGPNRDEIFAGTFTTAKGKSMPFHLVSSDGD